ncbi:hypothetical protein BLA50215_02785 [Burkholderia lata]|nr:hypothetical protein BLA50215_02785 [Burkholderia lata]
MNLIYKLRLLNSFIHHRLHFGHEHQIVHLLRQTLGEARQPLLLGDLTGTASRNTRNRYFPPENISSPTLCLTDTVNVFGPSGIPS